MKLVNFLNLVITTLSLLVVSQPLASQNSKPSDVLIGLNLDQCTVNIPLPNLAAQQDTAREVIRAYNVWDIEAILAYRTPDCKHQVLPLSMNRTGKSNDEYRAYFNSIRPHYVNFTATVIEELHDAKTHKCIIHARSRAQTKIGLYANEYALILTFTKDGKKVSHFDEFVDSAYSVKFQADLAKALEGSSTGSAE
ncbi:hypothetical protein CFE70_009470 [Pyrenophora teres f. teres 0-1]|uniref:SnoaL-like domain-containing protein n=1 Tax=Pyrenophora teres f. teres (strain 0-1) TaxID=861557 RepID=E3RL27_PYRTT|nr:hypothetical protein PTT_09028 [Pyrenophora teres f. teres 0-1]KAE8824048.1 hypothetical protein HRS9139_09230 [Pyrenophora teres f. teres]CAA9966074.1 hypothetical protein PTMSG1_09433 [Pyrenophora teres f. maculata]KAE8827253.1 hypothetical protein PTNB85_08606 [Pyrenophora teres f. teres]KAE8831451.1 hypothetical protein HRS9122_09041 [Pyrenophora teres f. teres]